MRKRSPKKSRQEKDVGKPVLIFDATALSYSAFYSMDSLTYRGKNTGVIFGFMKQVISIASQFKTDKLIFCWDGQGSWRKYDYPQYKESRSRKYDEMPPEDQEKFEDFINQRDIIHKQVLPNIGIKNTFKFHKFEADDLIGSLVINKFKDNKKIIVSDDNDLFQLLDQADMYLIRSKKIFSNNNFHEKFGIGPWLWTMAKSIGGCYGDDIKGIHGVGDPKNPSSKALKYLRGELSKGKIYDKITSKEGTEIIARNLPLVTVPYMSGVLPRMIIRKNTVTKRSLIQTFDKLGFISLLENENFSKLEEVFKL